MNIEIPDLAGTEDKLIQVSEALEQIKNVLAEVEQLLVHSNIPVSEIDVPY